MDEQNQPFHYTYSAREQAEIQKIREKYIAKEENKMEQLRRLDESATKTATVAALALGIISALVMGVGMCCTMVWADKWFVPGIIVGCIGLAGVIAAYPLYNRIAKKHREKIAPEILRLTEELSQQ
jgi:hypothetical protein